MAGQTGNNRKCKKHARYAKNDTFDEYFLRDFGGQTKWNWDGFRAKNLSGISISWALLLTWCVMVLTLHLRIEYSTGISNIPPSSAATDFYWNVDMLMVRNFSDALLRMKVRFITMNHKFWGDITYVNLISGFELVKDIQQCKMN